MQDLEEQIEKLEDALEDASKTIKRYSKIERNEKIWRIRNLYKLNLMLWIKSLK